MSPMEWLPNCSVIRLDRGTRNLCVPLARSCRHQDSRRIESRTNGTNSVPVRNSKNQLPSPQKSSVADSFSREDPPTRQCQFFAISFAFFRSKDSSLLACRRWLSFAERISGLKRYQNDYRRSSTTAAVLIAHGTILGVDATVVASRRPTQCHCVLKPSIKRRIIPCFLGSTRAQEEST